MALDDNLRDQLIEWKKKLLEVRNISLEDAMDKIRLWEQARDQITEMTRTDVSTNVVGAKKAYGKTCLLRREGSVQNVKNMTISLAVSRVDLSSILPRQTLRNSLLFIALVLDSRFVEREEKPTLLMRLHSRVKIIHLLLL